MSVSVLQATKPTEIEPHVKVTNLLSFTDEETQLYLEDGCQDLTHFHSFSCFC